MVLLLLTPYPSGEAISTSRTGTHISFGEQSAGAHLRVEGVTEERLQFARAAITAVMGRNAAFEELFEAFLRLGNGRARLNTHVSFNFPDAFGSPNLDGASATVVEETVGRMQSLNIDDRKRVALALRWYLRAQDFRGVKEVANVDSLISYWVAFESLVMPNENLNSAVVVLAAIHRRPEAEIRQLLPIGRLFGLRGKIIHHGQTPSISFELLNFMDDLFVDALLHHLKVPRQPRTQAYLDGSAYSFLPEASS